MTRLTAVKQSPLCAVLETAVQCACVLNGLLLHHVANLTPFDHSIGWLKPFLHEQAQEQATRIHTRIVRQSGRLAEPEPSLPSVLEQTGTILVIPVPGLWICPPLGVWGNVGVPSHLWSTSAGSNPQKAERI